MLKRGEHDGCILAQNFLTVSRWSWVEQFSLKEESRGENVNMKNFNQDDFGTSPLYDIKATLSVSVAKGTSFFIVVHHPVYWTLNLHPCLIWKLCLKFFLFPSDIGFLNETKKFFFRSSTTRKKNNVIEIIHWCQVFETFEDITVFWAPLSRLERCVKQNCRSLES